MKPRIFKLMPAILSIVLLCGKECLAIDIIAGGMRLHKKISCLREIRDRNVIKQSLDYSCGPAGLATILNYYLNDPITEKEIINALLKSTPLKKVMERKGFSLLDLKNFAQDRGYVVNGYKMDIESLRTLGKPVLVPIKFKNYRHFVVVKAVVGDRVFIADPTTGNATVKLCNFTEIWQGGIGFVVEDKDTSNKKGAAIAKAHSLNSSAVPDYKSLKRIFEEGVIRTTVFPDEF